uniref:Zinc finger protein 865 n=1 Tax=Magallana gigas TaxID=29159 RepID=A0A8W8NSL6_MAGGI|nr:zinc finger protein 569 isoform X1 [Crassostrea gigas]
MSGKRKTDYAKVLSVLLDHMARQPSVVVDFEAGLWKAIRETINAEMARQRSLKLPYTGKLCYKLPSGKTVVIKLVDNLRSAQEEHSISSSSTQQGNGDESSSCDEICCSSVKTVTSQENSKSNTETTAVKSEDGFTVIRWEGLKKTKFNGNTCANKDKGISNSTVEKLANENVIWKQEISNSNTIDPKQNHPVNYQCIPMDRSNDGQENAESEVPNLASRRQPVVLKRNLSHSHETAGSAEHRFESRKQPVVVLERIKVESDLTVSNIPEELGKNMQEGCSENTGNINLSEDSVAGTLLDVNTEECSIECSKQGLCLRGVKKPYTRSGVQQKTKQSEDEMLESKVDCEDFFPFACGKCNYTSKLKHQLKRHMKLQMSDRPFVCEICKRAFKLVRYLSNHMLTHSKERPYSCEQCGRCFTQSSTLQRHIKRIHQGLMERIQYKCYTCGKSFSMATSLRRHSKMHENLERKVRIIKNIKKKKLTFNSTVDDHQREFECGECGRKFLRKEDVVKHMLTHTGESVYTCEVCGKGYGNKQALQKHINIHTGDDIEVDVSGSSSSSFFIASSLHSGIHENLTVNDHQRKFECGVCGCKFLKKNDVMRHMMTHTAGSINNNVCGKGYNSKKALQKHINIHTGDDIEVDEDDTGSSSSSDSSGEVDMEDC